MMRTTISSQFLTHSLTTPGRRRSRFNRRHIIISPRHSQNTPSIIRRFLGFGRLPWCLQWHWLSHSRVCAWSCPFLRHLRRYQTVSRTEDTRKIWRSRITYAGSDIWRSSCLRGTSTNRGGQTKGAGEAISQLIDSPDIYSEPTEDTWIQTCLVGVVSRMVNYGHARGAIYSHSIPSLGGLEEVVITTARGREAYGRHCG